MNDHQFTFRHHSAEATHAAWSTSLWFSCKSSQTPRRTPGTLKVIQTLRWKQFESCVTLLSSQQMNNGSPFPREPVHPQPASQLVQWKVDDLALITLESVFGEAVSGEFGHCGGSCSAAVLSQRKETLLFCFFTTAAQRKADEAERWMEGRQSNTYSTTGGHNSL